MLSEIIKYVGKFALGRILDRVFDDKAKDIEEAFNEAYNTWYVSHHYTIIQRKDYDRLKPRFIDYLCNKGNCKTEDEDEISLFEEWLTVIERGINAHDKLQSGLTQKIIQELNQFKAYQVQINEEMLVKLTNLVESAIGIDDISKKQTSLEKEIGEIKIQIANKGLDSTLQPQHFSKVNGYVERYIVSRKDKNNFVRFILKQKPQTLFDKITSAKEGENKFLLVDKGQSGKTTELQELGYKLSQSEKYFPLLFKSYDYPELSRKELPAGDFYDGKTIVLLIDAVDEFTQEERSRFFNFIADYADDHLHTIMVISCRNNYEEIEHLGKTNKFEEIAFEDLTSSQWTEMIKGIAGKKSEKLIRLIKGKKLYEYMATPFEVSVIANKYLSTGKLLTTRAEIYREFIYSKLGRDEVKMLPDSKQLKFEALPYLERVATVMQSYGNDFTLSYQELQSCFNEKQDMFSLIQRSNLIIPVGKDKYKFSENAYREYLAADYVSKLDFESILKFIKYDHADSVRQQWANVAVILLSILYSKNNDTFKQLLHWMIIHESEFVLFLERNTVDKKIREAIFNNLLAQYRKQKRLIAPANYQKSVKIMEFAQSTETMELLFTEVIKNQDKDFEYLENLYSFIECSDYTDLTLCNKEGLVKNFDNIVFHIISKHIEDKKDNTFVVYSPLRNKYYHNDDSYLRRLLDTVGDTHNRFAVDAVMAMICFTGKYDEYTDYIINHEGDIHDYTDNRGVTVSVFRFSVDKALESVTKKENILKVLSHISKEDFLRQNYYHDSHILDIVKNLLKTAKDNAAFGNDINSYKQLLNIYSNFMASTLFYRSVELFIAFQNFFKDCTCNELLYEDSISYLRKVIKGNGNFEQNRKAVSLVHLLITKERIDNLIDSLDATDLEGRAIAAQISDIPDNELNAYYHKKANQKFTGLFYQDNFNSKYIESIDLLFDYEKFHSAVIDSINMHPQTGNDFRYQDSLSDKKVNHYVSIFFHRSSKEPFDLAKVKENIDNKDYYYHFLLFITINEHGNKEIQKHLTDEIKSKIKQAAEEEIINRRTTEGTLNLLVKGELNLNYNQIEWLLPYSYISIGEQNLFDFIAKKAETEDKKKQLVDYLCEHINDKDIDVNSIIKWACYLIQNVNTNLYQKLFDQLLKHGGNWQHLQVIEAYWSSETGKKFIRSHYNNLSEEDKMSLLLFIENSKDKKDADWIAEKLNDYGSYKDYNQKTALRFLIYRSDLNALKYITDNFDLKYIEDSFPYNYYQPEAADGILFLLHKVLENNNKIIPNCYNSLRQSIINICTGNKAIREKIFRDLNDYASTDGHGQFLDEIEFIQEIIYKSDDENKSFEEVINSVPLLKI